MEKRRGRKDKFITGTSKKKCFDFLKLMETLLQECEEGKIETKSDAVSRRNELISAAFAPVATADVDTEIDADSD